MFGFFFFNDTATTEIYTLSLHDALPIYQLVHDYLVPFIRQQQAPRLLAELAEAREKQKLTEQQLRQALREKEQALWERSEEHTSELQSRQYLVCRLLLEKKKNKNRHDAD